MFACFSKTIFLTRSTLFRFRKNAGIGLKFLLWLQSEIGMHWKNFQKRRDRQLVSVLIRVDSVWIYCYLCVSLLLFSSVFSPPIFIIGPDLYVYTSKTRIIDALECLACELSLLETLFLYSCLNLHTWLFIVLPFTPSSVGYRPFVEACVDAGEKDEALKYIPKLADLRERAEVSVARMSVDLKLSTLLLVECALFATIICLLI